MQQGACAFNYATEVTVIQTNLGGLPSVSVVSCTIQLASTSVTRHTHTHSLNVQGGKNYLEVVIQLPTRNNCPLALGWRVQ